LRQSGSVERWHAVGMADGGLSRSPVLFGAAVLAFSDVYERHGWQVYGFFAHRLNGHETEEDLTQLTFERTLRAWGRYDSKKALPLTWLLATRGTS